LCSCCHRCCWCRTGTPRQPHLVPSARGVFRLGPGVPAACLEGLEQFSHCWVLYVFHQNTGQPLLRHEAQPVNGPSFEAPDTPTRQPCKKASSAAAPRGVAAAALAVRFCRPHQICSLNHNKAPIITLNHRYTTPCLSCMQLRAATHTVVRHGASGIRLPSSSQHQLRGCSSASLTCSAPRTPRPPPPGPLCGAVLCDDLSCC